MKKLFTIISLAFVFTVSAQQKPTDVDKSPLDISYCPQNYPILKMNGKAVALPVARVIYSRPQKNGRDIFGGIVAYNQVWRVGANEATEIEFFRNVKINGKTVSKGRYTMYAICTETKWTIILNSENYVWGLLYNAKKDVVRTEVPVTKTDSVTEAFTMYFENAEQGANLVILWDNVKAILPVSY